MKSSIFVGFAIFAVTGAALAAEHSGPSRVDSSPSTTSAQTRCLDVNGDVQAKSSSMTASNTTGDSAAKTDRPASHAGASQNSAGARDGVSVQQRQASNGPPC